MPNLVKFISTLLQKIHQKSCSLLEQGEATPPKISSRKNHQRPNSFCRTPCMHCCCSKFRKFSFSVILRSSVSLTRSQCTWHVPRSPSLLSGASHACVEPSWHRWRAGPPSPVFSAASGPPVAADRRHTTAERRLAPPKAPWLSAWPHACQRTPVAPSPWPGKHGTCSLPPTGRATPVPSSSPIAPNPSPFST